MQCHRMQVRPQLRRESDGVGSDGVRVGVRVCDHWKNGLRFHCPISPVERTSSRHIYLIAFRSDVPGAAYIREGDQQRQDSAYGQVSEFV